MRFFISTASMLIKGWDLGVQTSPSSKARPGWAVGGFLMKNNYNTVETGFF